VRRIDSILLSLSERASKAIVWNTPMERFASVAGIYESRGDYTRPAGVEFYGLGVARSEKHGWYVEAYCAYEQNQARRARAAVAAHVGVPIAQVGLVRCDGFVPHQLGAGGAAAHAALARRHEHGTLGGFANDLLSNLLLAISNNHVFADTNRAALDDALIDSSSGTEFGRLHRYVPLLPQPGVNDLDAAAGWVHDTHEIHREPHLNGIRGPVPGLRVQKYGARTGYTTGRIASIAATAAIPYDGLGTANFRRCLRIVGDDGPFSLPGDSGSLVLDMNHSVVGIVFAGDQGNNYSLANWATALTQGLNIAFGP
jgi:hypothetical protein